MDKQRSLHPMIILQHNNWIIVLSSHLDSRGFSYLQEIVHSPGSTSRPDKHALLHPVFSTHDGSIPHDQTMERIDLFHLEQEARQSQLIACLTEIIDHFNQRLESCLGQSLEMMDHAVQPIPERIDKRICEFVRV